ncbi:uncharacterized protein ACNLHF_014893 isoform 2-T2 [Anomaloglossus baeobatrachus]
MTAVRKAILTTLLLYLLTSQEKVYSDVLLNEKIEDLTCNVQEHNRIAYKYDGEFFQRTDKVYEHASDGGIFTCERNKSNPTPPGNVSCESHIIVIVLSISENVTPTVIKEKVGQSISFQSQFNVTGSFTLLWIFKRNHFSRCIFSAAVIRTLEYVESAVNKLCCSTDDVKDKVLFRNQSALRDTHQNVSLEVVNLTSSDSGEYSCVKYYHADGTWKWKTLNTYLLEVTGDEEPVITSALVHNEATANPCCGSPTEGNDQEKMQKETPSYIIAGSVGGFFVVLATLLLAIFFIKKKAGNQMKMSRRSQIQLHLVFIVLNLMEKQIFQMENIMKTRKKK